MAALDGPEPSDMDRALLGLITETLDELPPDTATLTHAWSEGGGMWVVEVRPRAAGAAALDIAFDGGDLLNFNVGNMWFEVFPIKSVEDLDYAKDIALAVFRGDVEESTYKNKAWVASTLTTARSGSAAFTSPGPVGRGRTNAGTSRTRRGGARSFAAISHLRAADPTRQHPAGTPSRSSPQPQPRPGAHSVCRRITTSAKARAGQALRPPSTRSAIGSATLPGQNIVGGPS